MKRVAVKQITCYACGDTCEGVELRTLSGAAYEDDREVHHFCLCVDCLDECFDAIGTVQ